MTMKFISRFGGAKAGILAAILILGLTYLGLFADLLQRLDYWALDYGFHLAGKGIETPEVVIVAVDDESIRKLGRWPWPRSYHAKLIDTLNQAKARVIGLNIILSTPDPPEDHQLIRAIKKAKNVIMAAHPMIPTHISFPRDIMTVEHIQGPVEEMAKGAKGLGHIAVVYDRDGTVRRIPALLRTRDKTLLAFGIEIALACQGESHRSIILDKRLLQVNSTRIPLDSQGNMLVNYRGGPHTFTEIPYHRVIGGEVPLDIFKDRVVLVGVTASGLSDSWATPFLDQGEMSGVEIHANTVHTILNKEFFRYPGSHHSAFLLLGLGIISGLVFHRFSRLGSAFLIFMIFFIPSASFYLFLKERIILKAIPLLGVVVATYISVTLIKSRAYKMAMGKRDLEMSAVLKAREAVKNPADKEEFMGSFCRIIKEMTRVDACYAILKGKDGNILIYGNNHQETAGHFINLEMVEGVLHTGKSACEDMNQKISGATGIMYVPIKSSEQVYGVLALKGKTLSDTQDMQLASIVTDYLAFILEKETILDRSRDAYMRAVEALVHVIELGYPKLHEYSSQVLNLSEKIALVLNIPKDEIEVIKYAAILHDLGMAGIPEDLLNKSDSLTAEQRLYIETHPEMSVEIIRPLPFFKTAIPIIRHHHERYDGKGYPDGLASDEIPRGAQILAVADSFVAMLSDRPYRKAREQKEAISEMKRQSGAQFNPRVVDALLQSWPEVNLWQQG
ncbi:MAG: CHASE2 domain-containing protein [Thermodesulfobacteriota bacterium]|nr:CHASE2 domain-containing protein [Thermodesulfobacteriota bacterium]